MKSRKQRFGAYSAAVLVAFACTSNSGGPQSPSAPVTQSRSTLGTPPPGASPAALAAAAGGLVMSSEASGTPRLIVAAGPSAGAGLLKDATPETAAREHLRSFLAAQRAGPEALSSAELVGERALGKKGARLLSFKQRVDGVDVLHGDVKVLLGKDNALLAISGSLRSTSSAKAAMGSYSLSAADAVARAMSDRFAVPVTTSRMRPAGAGPAGYQLVALAPGSAVRLDEPAHAKRVLVASGDRLRAAYYLEFVGGMASGGDSEGFGAVVAADDGAVLERADLTANDFQYRVWAETTGERRPLDGPTQDWTPHPTGTPDGTIPGFTTPSLVTVDGINHNPAGIADPWLPAGSTQTRGNNIDAYTDQLAPDGFSNGDVRATATAAGVFDRTYDTALNGTSSQAQMMAAVTNAFYVTNWLHDYWYDSGFNELGANAQFDNYSRGGLGGDGMKVEVQDNYVGGSRNNANMNTPADGFQPRMQMFVWSGPDTRSLTLNPGGTIAAGVAAFGPQSHTVTGDLILADDGSTAGAGGTITDGCTALVNNVAGKIVLVDRGVCTFKTKTLVAQNAGAIGVLMADNRVAAVPPGMGDDATITTPITIPTFSTLQADGNTLKANLLAGTVTATLFRLAQAERDAGLDALVMSHEWGHYFHHRSTDCSTKQCSAQSEGWGDFVALHTSLRSGDNLDGTYAGSIYAGGGLGDAYYGGIRRYPYTVDFTKNGLTLGHITDGAALPPGKNPGAGGINSEVHNAGEVWCNMLFEAYVALQRTTQGGGATRTFDEVRRAMADYIVGGLHLAPPQATYTETRDAILTAAQAINAADAALMAQAFATRGAGSCAVAPPPNSTDFSGITESFALKSSLVIGKVKIDDSGASCDHDGVLDADETGKVTIELTNAGASDATGATLQLSTTSTDLTFPNGASVTLADLAPHATVEVTVDVALAAAAAPMGTINVDMALAEPTGCTTTHASTSVFRGNYDDRTAQSANDDVESDKPAWAPTGLSSSSIWTRPVTTAPNHVWLGTDSGFTADTSLISPPLVVGAAGNFVVTFNHSYSFETAGTQFFDGGMIELSTNGGASWQDVSTFGVTPGYGGALFVGSGNSLGGRQAYVQRNAAYPAMDAVSLDFGTQFAGQTVRIRFRIATDVNAGDEGWKIDDLTFAGITNTPFSKLLADTGTCPVPPVAVAGADQTVNGGTPVFLDASGSTDADGDALTFAWSQTAGPNVNLQGTANALTGFAAPSVTADTVFTFRVTVGDGTFTSSDTVDITVRAPPANQLPVAAAGADRSVAVGAAVFLDASGSTDPDANPLTFAWTQTAGPSVTLTGASSAVSGFTAPSVAADTVLTFQVSVGDGAATSTDTVSITVQAPAANQSPVAAAGADRSVAVGAAVFLDASASADPDANPLTFAWTQTAGPGVTLTGASTAVSGFTAPSVTADTVLTFQVSVGDGAASSTDTVSITVRAPAANRAPTAAAGADQQVGSGDAVILDGSGSTDPDGNALTYTWTKTAGPDVTLTGASGSTAGFKAPAVESPTDLTFQLSVSDGTATATDTVTITVGPPPSSGCSCTTSAGAPQMFALLAAALFLARRRKVA